MAVKAATEVTITDETDILSLVTWYALTNGAAPTKPSTSQTSATVPSPWTTVEPSFDPAQGTKYLYTVIQTRWKDGACTWDNDVQLSSSYEQAKAAWNKTNAVEQELDSMEIGARNLLRWTEKPELTWSNWNTDPTTSTGWGRWSTAWSVTNTTDGIKGTSTSSNSSGFAIPLVYENAAIGGVEYTLSFDYKTNRSSLGDIYLLCVSGGNALVHSVAVTASTSEWKHYEQTMTWPSTSGKVTRALLIPYIGAANDWFEIRNGSIKLEKGNKATSWTPAIEDIEASIAEAAKVAGNYIVNAGTTGDAWIHSEGHGPDSSGNATSNTYGWRIGSVFELVRAGLSYLKMWVDSNLVARVRVGLESAGHSEFSPEGMEVFTDSSTSVAQFGETSRIGLMDGMHAEISSYGMQLLDTLGNTYYRVGYLFDSDGYAVISQSFHGDGSTTQFTVGYRIIDVLKATVNGSNVGVASSSALMVTLSSPPDNYSKVIITYRTDKAFLKSYTFGTRFDGEPVGEWSIAEGQSNTAEGQYSKASGYANISRGYSSFSEGYGTRAYGDYSHAQNQSTYAESESQTAIGRYNVGDARGLYAFIIGNGTGDSYTDRSNALAVTWDGAEYFRATSAKPTRAASAPSANTAMAGAYHYDASNSRVGYSEIVKNTSNNIYRSFAVENQTDTGTTVTAAFYLTAGRDGTTSATLSSGTTWPVANGGTGQTGTTTTYTVGNVISAASNITIGTVGYAQWGKVAQLRVTFTTTVARSGSWTIGTLVSGKRPVFVVRAGNVNDANMLAMIGADGVITVGGAVAANTSKEVGFTYLLA